MSVEIEVLRAFNGDSILISFEDLEGVVRNILIDGGISEAFGTPLYQGELQSTLERIKAKGQFIDLLVVSHIDDDHIGGILRFYEKSNCDTVVKSVWFNSGDLISKYFNTAFDPMRDLKLYPERVKKTSVRQGITLENKLRELAVWKQEVTKAGDEYIQFPGCTIKVVSPSEKGLEKLNRKWEVEKAKIKTSGRKDYGKSLQQLLQEDIIQLDNSIPNGGSIALLIEIKGKKLLMLADAHSPVVVEALKEMGYSSENKLELDLIKLSHHGSKKNTCNELLRMVNCNKYVCSTDGTKHGLPNKVTFSRILEAQQESPTFFFNYDLADCIFSEADREDLDFETIYLGGQPIKIL